MAPVKKKNTVVVNVKKVAVKSVKSSTSTKNKKGDAKVKTPPKGSSVSKAKAKPVKSVKNAASKTAATSSEKSTLKGFVPAKKLPVKKSGPRTKNDEDETLRGKKFSSDKKSPTREQEQKGVQKKSSKAKPTASTKKALTSTGGGAKKAEGGSTKEKTMTRNTKENQTTKKRESSVQPSSTKKSKKVTSSIGRRNVRGSSKASPGRTKKVETSSEDEDDESEEEAESPKERKSRSADKKPTKASEKPSKTTAAKKSPPRKKSAEKSQKPTEKSTKSVEKSPNKKSSPTKNKYDSSSEEESDEEQPKVAAKKIVRRGNSLSSPSKKQVVTKKVTTADKKQQQSKKKSVTTKKESSSSSSASSSSDEEEEDQKSSKKKTSVSKKAKASMGPTKKAKLAQMKLKQMQSLGFWGAPPRRAASLNAAAMMHVMYDTFPSPPKTTATTTSSSSTPTTSTPSTEKGKVKSAKKEGKEMSSDEEVSFSKQQQKKGVKKSSTTDNSSKKSNKQQQQRKSKNEKNESSDESSDEKDSGKKQRKKSPASKQQQRQHQALKSVKDDEVLYSDENDSTDTDDSEDLPVKPSKKPETPKSSATKKKKRTMKDEFKMDIRDMIVQKRIASLNASAIMTATSDRWRSPVQQHPKPEMALKAIEYIPSTPSTSTATTSHKTGSAGKSKSSKSWHEQEAFSPDRKRPKREENHIIVEIEDERIKSQLIASAMKKAAGGMSGSKSFGSSGKSSSGKKKDRSSSSETNTVVMMRSGGPMEPARKKLKKKHRSDEKSPPKKRVKVETKRKIVVDSSSSSDDDSVVETSSSEEEEELEEIVTDGARGNCPVTGSSSAAGNSLAAMKTEMNKVDLIVDGRMAHAGMYQVVHRFETISTTTAVVPKMPSADQQLADRQPVNTDHRSVSSTGKYAPLTALASLQPGGNVPANQDPVNATGNSSGNASRFHSSFPTFASHQGYYQPTGPVIGSASPGSNSAAPPPTATVQPTVVSSTTSTVSYNRSTTTTRDDSAHQMKDARESPVKTSTTFTQQQQQPEQPQLGQPAAGFLHHPSLPGAFSYASPYGASAAYPYPTSADIYRAAAAAAVPPPAHIVHTGTAGNPFYAGPFSAVPPPPMPPYPYTPAEYRPSYSALYQPATAPTTFPPHGSFYLTTPTTDLASFQAAAAAAVSSAAAVPNVSAASSTTTTQLALPTAPHLPAAYYYSGYSYPYSAGRMIAPILALAPPPAGPPGHQASFYSYSVQQQQQPMAHVLPTVPIVAPTLQPQPGATVTATATTATPSGQPPPSHEPGGHSSKNGQAGPQEVGKGSTSKPSPTDIQSAAKVKEQKPQHRVTLEIPKVIPSVSKSAAMVAAENKFMTGTKKEDAKEVNSVMVNSLSVVIPRTPVVPPVTNLPNGVVLPTTPLQPQQLNIKPREKSASKFATQTSPSVLPAQSSTSQKFTSAVSPTTIQAMLANVKPVLPVSNNAAGGNSKSTLRNYRRPTSRQQQPSMSAEPMIKADTSNGNNNKSITALANVIGARALPNDISVTPIVGKASASSSPADVKRAIEHQPPSVSCYQIASGPRDRPTMPMTIGDLVAANKMKEDQNSSGTNRSFQIPKGLTITEISRGARGDDPNAGVTAYNEVQALPVLHIPDVASAGDYDLLRKFDEASATVNVVSGGSKRMAVSAAAAMAGNHGRNGHPGMPNGLLRMTASLQQKTDGYRPGIGTKMATKVTPKDLKSQLALDKISLSMDNNHSSAAFQQQQQSTSKTQPSMITMSMAESAASAVSIMTTSKFSQKRHESVSKSSKSKSYYNGGPQAKHSSPASSTSSSRNSSISPRDRTGSVSINARSGSSIKSSGSGTVTPKSATGGTGSCQVSPKPLHKTGSSKKKPGPVAGPLIPWSKRNSVPPKHSSGWSWLGDGTEQLVYLNNEDPPVNRICYSAIQHTEGDVVKPRDCIIVAAGNRKKDLPFIAKVTAFWEDPDDGEMFMSLLWYYRPEHIESGRRADDLPDEIYASRHRDFTSVACIEDKCYVMTFNEYCRYRKFLRMVEQNVPVQYSIVPELMEVYERAPLLPRCRVAPDRVFLCRKVYESRQRRVLKNPY